MVDASNNSLRDRRRTVAAGDGVVRHDPGVNAEASLELVWLHARMLKRMPIIQCFLLLGFWLIISSSAAGTRFIAWAALSLTVECVRAYYGAQALKLKRLADARHAHVVFVVLAALAGGAIGLGAILFLPESSVVQRATLGFLLTGIPAAGVAVSQSSKYIIGSYALSILVPAGHIWGVIYPDQAAAMGILPLLYSGVLMLVAADGEKLVLRSIIIRHERDRVVKDLEQRNADVRDAMAKAEQSAQARARVLAAASHDLRQPLQALSVYSAILAANPTPETLREVGRDIDQIVRSLGSLLGGLLDLSRLSSGHYVPDKKIFALDEIVDGICHEMKSLASAKGLALIRTIAPMRLRGDAVAAGRITRNLLDNAIKYTDAGELRIETAIEGELAVLSITDSGRGIPQSEHNKIFEEFYQLDNPGRDRTRGVGLGLTIVQRLCELLEAKVTVDSAPGRGARFSVAFPGLINHSPSADSIDDSPDAARSSAALVGKRVYVVDDEIDIRKNMCALLEMWGMTVWTAASPAEANVLFNDCGRPDVLIADLRLGSGEHGAAMAERLRHAFGPFPVLIITGETVSDALRQANEDGYVVLQKPIAPEALHEAINAAVTRAPTV